MPFIKAYRQFVTWGIGRGTIWRKVNGQSNVGGDDFVESLIPHIKKHQDISEIPKSHWYVNRPSLERIFTENVILDKRQQDMKHHGCCSKIWLYSAVDSCSPPFALLDNQQSGEREGVIPK